MWTVALIAAGDNPTPVPADEAEYPNIDGIYDGYPALVRSFVTTKDPQIAVDMFREYTRAQNAATEDLILLYYADLETGAYAFFVWADSGEEELDEVGLRLSIRPGPSPHFCLVGAFADYGEVAAHERLVMVEAAAAEAPSWINSSSKHFPTARARSVLDGAEGALVSYRSR